MPGRQTSLKTFTIFSLLVALLCLPSKALSEEIYKFERLWPTLQQPWYFPSLNGVITDNRGNVYVADFANSNIQKLTSDGQFIRKWGRFGEGEGEFNYPGGMAIDAQGNVYVADSANHRIQVFTPDGQYIRKWGHYGQGEGEFDRPTGVAIDGQGEVYVADTYNNRIQKFTADGQFITKWGTTGTGDGQFSMGLGGIAVDGQGKVYVSDRGSHRVQKFASNGQFIGTWGHHGEGGGEFNDPVGIAVDGQGMIYVSDTQNYRIQKFGPDGQFIQVIGYYGPGHPDNLYSAENITVDTQGYVYAAETYYRCIKKFTADGRLITRWSSSGSANGEFAGPDGIATDNQGNIYVADNDNYRLQEFTQDGQFIRIMGYYGPGEDNIYSPRGVAVDNQGYVYVTDWFNNRIKKFSPNNELITIWGGSPGKDEGALWGPTGLAVDGQGNVYVAEQFNNRIQKFTSAGQLVKTWGNYGTREGDLNLPAGLAVDGQGNVYVAEQFNHRIQKFTQDGQSVRTWGHYGKGAGEFWEPQGIAVDSEDNVYVADTRNHRIQKFTSDGQFITTWGAVGAAPGQMSYPTWLTVSSEGSVFVVDSGNNRIQKFRKSSIASNSKAIIVAGGGPYPGNDLWDATQMSANFAYRTLTYQGFTKDKISYLTSANIDLDNNGILDDVAGDATNTNLQNAITNWAKDADDVIVYLVDHGGTDSFRMSGNETLSATKLASWLNILQNSITGKVIVIYDACESGSFVGDLVPPPGKTRIIIASTSPGESAYFVTQGSVSFSNYFWSHIFNGVNIKDAFALTKDAIKYTTPYQQPLLDANGNGTANEAEDLSLVQSAYIGNGTVIYGNAPAIGSVPAGQTITNTSSALLYADNVTDADGIARVWAVIRPPNYNQGGSDNPVQDLPSIDLMPVGNDRHEATYHAFNIPGTYQIAVYARDRIGNTSIPRITAVSVTNPLRRKAIIVAGGSQSDPLWPAIERGVKLSYDALRFQGYTDDDLFLLSPASITGVTKLPLLSTKGNLSYAITNWAAANTEDLALYLMGRGDAGIFRVSSTETLLATELKTWLDALQATISGAVTVVYDAPLSGSFLPLLKPSAGKKRILLSSTGAAQPVYFLSNGNISFSRFFWGGVLNGATLWNAYVNARKAMGFLCADQTPLLDDNGDGMNTKGDGSVARNYVLGFGITLAADDPRIGFVSPLQTLTGQASATIWAKDVTTTGTVDKVWGVITPPGGNQVPLNVPVTTLPGIIELTYNDSSLRYEGSYNGFATYGPYDIAIYAMDTDGNISQPITTKVIQTLGPDQYENDNTVDKASISVLNDALPQVHTFHAPGDEDWVKFYALKDQVYVMKASNLGGHADVVLELYKAGDMTTNLIADLGDLGGSGEDELVSWRATDNGIYYVRARNSDPHVFGAGTNYDLKVYRPIAPDMIGILKGIVVSDHDQALITGAVIQAGLGSALSQNGSFTLLVEAGTVNVSVAAAGFRDLTLQNVEVQAGQEKSVNVSLVTQDTSNGTMYRGDLNHDRVVDIVDAILALQVLANMTPAQSITKDADVSGDGKIGIQEIIYIIQKVAGVR